MAGYGEEYPGASLGTGPEARGPAMFAVRVEGRTWHVRQTFDDPEGDRDWGFSAVVDLDASDESGTAELTVTSIGPLSEQPAGS